MIEYFIIIYIFYFEMDDYTDIPKIIELFNAKDLATTTTSNNKYYNERFLHNHIRLPRFISGTKCYLCKENINKFHWFYYSLCPTCGDKCFEFRHLKTDLSGYRAIVTGARLK